MKKVLIGLAVLIALLAGVYFGYFRKGASLIPGSDKSSGAAKSKEEVQKEQERIARSIAEQTAAQQRIQQAQQSSIENVQRTLRTVEEVNRINRQNQQLQQQNRK